MSRKNNLYRQIVLPTVAGAAGLAVVAVGAFTLAHRGPNARQTVATLNKNQTSVSTTNVNTSGTTHDTNTVHSMSNVSNNSLDSSANDVALTDANTPNNAQANSTANGGGNAPLTANSTQSSPLNPGTLGEPANSPAGPTPPAGSPIQRVSISAATNSVELGTPDQFVIHGYDKQGKAVRLSGQHITYRVFGPNDGSAVSSTGVFIAHNASIYQVDALVDGVQSNLVTITVGPKTHPYHVTLTSSSNLVAGSSLQSVVMVHVVDVNGHDVQGATVTFSDGNPSVVSIDSNKETTDVNGMASVQATPAGQSGGSATITAKVTTSGESASTSVVVNAKPAKIELQGKVVDMGEQMGYFLVKVEDAQGNGIPGIATKPTISGGAILGANQYAFTSDASGIVKIPVNFMNIDPIDATVTVMGTNVTWSDTLNR